ncbi:NUDIX hydrolase [Nocardioides ultimimeridianus]
MKYTAAPAVDLVVLTVSEGALRALVVERAIEPFRGARALPGGFVLADEDLLDAARRELAEETGLAVAHLEQLATYGAPSRDPRGRVVSIAYLALLPDPGPVAAGSDAAAAYWHPVGDLMTDGDLAFDHAQILRDGVERARSKLEYTPLATAFTGEPFAVSDLREVYEAVWGRAIDPRNFHRKVTSVAGLLEATGEVRTGDRGRPAALYRRGPAELLLPPLMRAELRSR